MSQPVDERATPIPPLDRGIRTLLVVLAIVELLAFVVVAARGRDAFLNFVSTPDTNTYIAVAEGLVRDGQLIAGFRTLGYPAFLTVCYSVGGLNYGAHVAIAVHLALNLLLTAGAWRLVRRVAPDIGPHAALAAAVFAAYSGMGMAFVVLTDLLGGLSLFGFLYGLLFWRRRRGIALAAFCLFYATLLRPSFTFFPVVVPILAWLAGRFTTRVPKSAIIAAMLACVAGTGVSIAYQYRCYGYLGPSSVVAYGLRSSLWHALGKDRYPTEDENEEAFFRALEQRHGRPRDQISKNDEEAYAKELFTAAMREHPRVILTYVAKTGIGYLFAPVEFLVLRTVVVTFGSEPYFQFVRPVLGLLCLPIWILSLLPPFWSERRFTWYFAFTLLVLVYAVGTSSGLARQGERYRFPVVPFLLPIAIRNLADGLGWLRRRHGPQPAGL